MFSRFPLGARKSYLAHVISASCPSWPPLHCHWYRLRTWGCCSTSTHTLQSRPGGLEEHTVMADLLEGQGDMLVPETYHREVS